MRKVAVIIVNYNCFQDTQETIGSLREFDQDLFDIFLVDNHSTEDNLLEISRYASQQKIDFIPLEKNLGFAGGNNVAIQKTLELGYDYIFLLNPDTLVEDKRFFEVLEQELITTGADIIGPLIKYYPEKDKIYFDGGFVDKYTGLTKMRGKKKKDQGQYRESVECDFITGCAILIKRQVFEKIGLLPEEYFLYFEEADFCLQAKKAGFKVVFTSKTFLYHKVSTSIDYLSNTYLYYMVRNQRLFSKKYVRWYFQPIFWIFYLFIWFGGYCLLALKNRNIQGLKYAYKGLVGASIG